METSQTIEIEGSISEVMQDDTDEEIEEEAEEVYDDIPYPGPTPPDILLAEEAQQRRRQFDACDLSPDEREKRRKLIKKIRLYMANMTDLKPLDIDALEMNASNKKLELVIEDIEFQTSSKRSFEIPMMAYKFGVQGLESTSCHFGLKVQGLAHVCTTNDDIIESAKELFIKYDMSKTVSVEARLAMSIGLVMVQLHEQNSDIERKVAARVAEILREKEEADDEPHENDENNEVSDKQNNNKDEMFNDL
jgi:hypothetical protein